MSTPVVAPVLVPAQRGDDLPRGVADALALVDPASVVGLLQELLAVPTVTGSAAESEGQHLLEVRLRAAGMDTDLWSVDLPTITADPDFPGMEAARDEAWGLVGSWGGEDPDAPTVVLNGHLDVVPTGGPELWTVDPWQGRVRDGRVLGRGACDMKGGLACQVLAVEVLRRAGVRLRGRVQLQSVVGEEDGGLGTFATLRRGYRGDLAVISEPTSGALVIASAGALTFRLTVPGRSAHGSMRLEGVDAVEKYLLVHQALRRLEARRNGDVTPLMARYALPYPLSVGTVRAGDWASSVPDALVAEGRYGVALGEPVEAARAELEGALAQVCADDPWLAANPVRVEWVGGQFASGSVDAHAPVVQAVSSAHARLHGARPPVHGVPYGSDLRLLTGIGGVPTVHYGPGDVAHAHAPDESVPVDELVAVTRTLVLLVASTAGGV
ncbi:MAG: ArgE/DapE family deacylase [Frankiaceae bacterium]|nr:ArgE/DapE family deacylase [Frankiaceae bacterium]